MRDSMVDAKKRLEQIRQKYRNSENVSDLLDLKKEIELVLGDLQLEETENNKELIEEYADMLIDVTFKIEESRCAMLRGVFSGR